VKILSRWLAVKVFLGEWSIDVEASREWIVIEWEPLESTRESTEAMQRGNTRTSCKRRYIQYQWTINTTNDAMKSVIEDLEWNQAYQDVNEPFL
jgi:hypothetical protein